MALCAITTHHEENPVTADDARRGFDLLDGMYAF
jgi:hypothetical protein